MLYYFDTRDGESFCHDGDGVELPTIEGARRLARRALGDMAKDAAMVERDGRELVVQVRNDVGQSLFKASLWFEVSGLH